MLKFVYTFFLGLLLAIFIGFGIATFYPSPKAPEYPKVLSERAINPGEYTAEEKAIDRQYQKDSEEYNKTFNNYNRNVSMIALAAAVIVMAIGLLLETRIGLLADGLLLGGVFTLLYSIGRSFASQDPRYSFIVVSIGLVLTIVVGYQKFIHPQAGLTKSKK